MMSLPPTLNGMRSKIKTILETEMDIRRWRVLVTSEHILLSMRSGPKIGDSKTHSGYASRGSDEIDDLIQVIGEEVSNAGWRICKTERHILLHQTSKRQKASGVGRRASASFSSPSPPTPSFSSSKLKRAIGLGGDCKCPFCFKRFRCRFSWKADLRVHLKTHSKAFSSTQSNSDRRYSSENERKLFQALTSKTMAICGGKIRVVPKSNLRYHLLKSAHRAFRKSVLSFEKRESRMNLNDEAVASPPPENGGGRLQATAVVNSSTASSSNFSITIEPHAEATSYSYPTIIPIDSHEPDLGNRDDEDSNMIQIIQDDDEANGGGGGGGYIIISSNNDHDDGDVGVKDGDNDVVHMEKEEEDKEEVTVLISDDEDSNEVDRNERDECSNSSSWPTVSADDSSSHPGGSRSPQITLPPFDEAAFQEMLRQSGVDDPSMRDAAAGFGEASTSSSAKWNAPTRLGRPSTSSSATARERGVGRNGGGASNQRRGVRGKSRHTNKTGLDFSGEAICPFCQCLFDDITLLKIHCYERHLEAKFFCELCLTPFAREPELLAHVYDQHGDIISMCDLE